MRKHATVLQWRIGDSNQDSVVVGDSTLYDEHSTSQSESGAKTGAVAAADPRLSAIIAAWPSLTEAEQDALLAQAVENSTSQSQTNRS